MTLQNIYIILYSKMELLQPPWGLIENKVSNQKLRDKNNLFPVTYKLFEVKYKFPHERGIKTISPGGTSPPSRASSLYMKSP